jgi:hypothetical protein
VKISISAETAPLLGNSRASSPSRFNRGAEKLQQIWSNRGPRLLPTISFVENNSPVKARLVGGKLLDPQLLNPARPGGSTRARSTRWLDRSGFNKRLAVATARPYPGDPGEPEWDPFFFSSNVGFETH